MMADDIDFMPADGDTLASLHRRFMFVDVRETPELAAQPLPDAVHIPTSAFDSASLKASKETEVLVVCARGIRSRKAADYLRAQGWSKVYSLANGIGALPST